MKPYYQEKREGKEMRKVWDWLLYGLCYPLRLLDEHTAWFSRKYFEE